MYKIAIDNGHGYNTSGKRTPKMPDGKVIREWEFNHPTAKKLEAAVKRCGMKPVMVSDTREDTPLATRTSTANDAKADLFVSIHYNAFDGKWGNHGGIETYYYPTSNNGKRLAELVQSKLVNATGLRDRGAKSAKFYVLRKTIMPGILCECGFMDNLQEARLMLDASYQTKVAEAICRGICHYLGIKYVPQNTSKSDDLQGGIYRVQVGAFKDKNNANRLMKDLKSKGYDAFIKEE